MTDWKTYPIQNYCSEQLMDSPHCWVETDGLGLGHGVRFAVIGQDDLAVFHFAVYLHHLQVGSHAVAQVEIAPQPVQRYRVRSAHDTRVLGQELSLVPSSVRRGVDRTLDTQHTLMSTRDERPR